MAILPKIKIIQLPIKGAIVPPVKDPNGAAIDIAPTIKEKTLPSKSLGTIFCREDRNKTFVIPIAT